MGKRWEGVSVVNVGSGDVDKEWFEKIVEEVAEIIYSDICQLSKIQFSDSFNEEINFLQRTGTDA